MNLNYFTEWTKEQIKNNPNKRKEIIDIFEYVKAEIDDGGSECHELEMAVSNINEIVKGNTL